MAEAGSRLHVWKCGGLTCPGIRSPFERRCAATEGRNERSANGLLTSKATTRSRRFKRAKDFSARRKTSCIGHFAPTLMRSSRGLNPTVARRARTGLGSRPDADANSRAVDSEMLDSPRGASCRSESPHHSEDRAYNVALHSKHARERNSAPVFRAEGRGLPDGRRRDPECRSARPEHDRGRDQ